MMKEKNNSKKLLIGLLIIALIITTISALNNIINNKKENITSNAILNTNNLAELKIKVSIPCPGHAGLIKNELSRLEGINSINFNLPNIFIIKYDSKQVSEQDILNLEIFKEYPATKI